MGWQQRLNDMKTRLGLYNNNIEKITGNTIDTVEIFNQPRSEMPSWLKLTIVVYETKLNKVDPIGLFKKHSKEGVFDFIRERFAFDENLSGQSANVKSDGAIKNHRRFEMSGFESQRGQFTSFNLSIVNEGAYLGIYDD